MSLFLCFLTINICLCFFFWRGVSSGVVLYFRVGAVLFSYVFQPGRTQKFSGHLDEKKPMYSSKKKEAHVEPARREIAAFGKREPRAVKPPEKTPSGTSLPPRPSTRSGLFGCRPSPSLPHEGTLASFPFLSVNLSCSCPLPQEGNPSFLSFSLLFVRCG